jgi:hypothetical protein
MRGVRSGSLCPRSGERSVGAIITNYVEVETHALLLRKLGRTLAREWLLSGGLPVLRVLPQEEERAKVILVASLRLRPPSDRRRAGFQERRRLDRALARLIASPGPRLARTAATTS